MVGYKGTHNVSFVNIYIMNEKITFCYVKYESKLR